MSRKMLYLEWEDSMSFSGKVWKDIDIVEDADLMCESCGFVIGEDKTSITLAGSTYGGSMAGDMTIPKSAIRKRRVLRHK